MEIVIAPKKMHRSILKNYRKNDPFFDIKIATKNELERYVYPSIKKESIVYLMNKYGYSYETCKMYVSYLPYVISDSQNFKMHFLYELKRELNDNGFIESFSYIHNPYLNKEVKVIGYSKIDKELETVFNALNINPQYINSGKFTDEAPLFSFEKVEEEVYFVLNKIASLIDKGVDISNIYILKRDSVYDYYLKKYAPGFGYQINLPSEENYASTGAFKEFIKLYKENGDISLCMASLKEKMKDDPLYDDIEKLILENIDKSLLKEAQLDYLYNVLKEKKIKQDRFDKAVEVISSPIYSKDSHIFVVGFAQGLFPQSIKDSNYLNNNEVDVLGRNNTKVQTRIDNDTLLDFFNSNNHFYYSFSEKSIKGKYFVSPISKDLNLTKQKGTLDNNFYSNETIRYIFASLKDLEYFYKERKEDLLRTRDVISIDYNSYDNAYNSKVNAFNENSKLSLSTTQLDLYSKCPFHYYLSRVIKLDEDEETSALRLGNIAHHIFEHQHDSDFDFDAYFDKEIANFELENMEKLLLTTKLKEQIKEAVNNNFEREKHYKNPRIYNEINLTHIIDDRTEIIGKIDNLVTLDDKYFICIDYKTGSSSSTKFSSDKLKYGLSSQLPTYSLLTSEDNRFEGLEIIGIYLNHVISTSMTNKRNPDTLIYDYLKLHGKSIDELEKFTYIDSTIADGASSFVASVSIKKDNTFSSSSSFASAQEFEDYKTITEGLFVEAAKNIRDNKFDINPIYFSDNEHACLYCPFKDICYRKDSQFRVIKKEEEEVEE